MERNDVVRILQQARQMAQQGQFMPAINFFMQVIENQDTIELREELIELLQKVNNLRACAEQCVLIGYRLQSKDDLEGALKSFARALKFNPQEYEALEKLAEICMESPEVPKKLKFDFDKFLQESFKIHFQHENYHTVEQAYGSIADLLSKKSVVHKLVAQEFEKKNIPNFPESRRLEILARIYSLQKNAKKSKKAYQMMAKLEENATHRSGLMKSVEFLEEQQKRRWQKLWKASKWFVLAIILIISSFFYYQYHLSALKNYQQLKSEIDAQIQLLHARLPSAKAFNKAKADKAYPQLSEYFCIVFDTQEYQPLFQKYEEQIRKKFPLTPTYFTAGQEIQKLQTSLIQQHQNYQKELNWFKEELENKISPLLRKSQEKDFEGALAELEKLQALVLPISDPLMLSLQTQLKQHLLRIQKEFEIYQKFQLKQQEEQRQKEKEAQVFLEIAQKWIAQGQYQKAFQEGYRPLFDKTEFATLPLVQKLSVPYKVEVPPSAIEIYYHEEPLPKSFWERKEGEILLQLPLQDFFSQKEFTLVFKSKGFEPYLLTFSLEKFPSETQIKLKRQLHYQFKTPPLVKDIIFFEQKLFFGGNDGKVYGLDFTKPFSSEAPWFLEKKLADSGSISANLVPFEHFLMVSTKKEYVYFLDWKSDTSKKFRSNVGFAVGGAALTNGFVLADGAGKLQTFIQKGNQLSLGTKTQLNGTLSAPLFYSASHNLIFVALSSGWLYALKNQNNLPLRWKVQTGDILEAPFVEADQVFLKTNTSLIALDIQGEILWRFPEKESFSKPLSGIAWHKGELFFGDSNGQIYCLDAKRGTLKWKVALSNNNISAKPVIFEDQVFIGAKNGHLSVLDRSTGKILWTATLGGEIQSMILVSPSPQNILEKHLLLVASSDAFISVFDLE